MPDDWDSNPDITYPIPWVDQKKWEEVSTGSPIDASPLYSDAKDWATMKNTSWDGTVEIWKAAGAPMSVKVRRIGDGGAGHWNRNFPERRP